MYLRRASISKYTEAVEGDRQKKVLFNIATVPDDQVSDITHVLSRLHVLYLAIECVWGGGGGVGTRRYLIVCLWRRLLASRHCSFGPSMGPNVFCV